MPKTSAVMGLENYRVLCERLGLAGEIPYTRDWSAAADFLELLVDHVRAVRPRCIVECGSGLSTLMLARACALYRVERIISLENGAEFAQTTRDAIAQHGLNATVLHAPLRNYALGVNGSEVYPWYALDGLPEHGIDMLVIDGPPGSVRSHARYPALPLLNDRLEPGCTIFMDDAARPHEQQILARWLAEYPGLQAKYIPLVRGCGRLTWPVA